MNSENWVLVSSLKIRHFNSCRVTVSGAGVPVVIEKLYVLKSGLTNIKIAKYNNHFCILKHLPDGNRIRSFALSGTVNTLALGVLIPETLSFLYQ